MPKFRVTEMMLSVVDDYIRNNGTKSQAEAGLRYHFPNLTSAEINKVLEKWQREMDKQ